MMKSAFIIGCGYTGVALADQLLADGWSVATLSREPRPLTGARVRGGDLLGDQPLDLEDARGAVVYYMVPPLFRSYDPSARPHLLPMRRVLAALRPLGLSRLIYLSSTSVYGDRGGAWVDEQTEPSPDSPWGHMRLELEELVGGFAAEAGVPSTVLRLPEIYGPGRGPLQRLRGGHALRHPDRWTNRIHRDDLVQVLRELGERDSPQLLLCGDDEPARAGVVYELAARLLGLAAVPTSDSEPSDPNRRALGRDSKRCRNAFLRAWLARPLRYPTYREGLPTTLDDQAPA